MKVIILGASGMLGNAVAKYFVKQSNIDEVVTTFRSLKKTDLLDCCNKTIPVKFDVLKDSPDKLPVTDYIINCIGITKPYVDQDKRACVKINSLFPYELADLHDSTDTKVIHITSDCVFSGINGGNYTESSTHDCLDFYGKSKSLGEPDNCMTIRTSIIGEELHSDKLLIGWIKSQKGGSISGFSHHLWNGITTEEYARCCHKIMTKGLYSSGLFNIFSPKPVNKFQLMNMLNDRFDLGIDIAEVGEGAVIDRTLDSIKDLVDDLKIRPIEEQIKNM